MESSGHSLFGRERELTALRAAFHRAETGHGVLVLLVGEPGIGKTRLASAFAEEVAASGARVSWGRAWEAGGAPAYWPWIEALRPFADAGASWAGAHSGHVAPLARLLPELGAFGTPLPPADPGQERFRLFDVYVQEWLDAQASGGYVRYCKDTQTYELLPEQAAALADELSPAFVPGMFQIMQAMWSAVDRMAEKFKTGDGLSWGEHHTCLFEGTERFFRAGYRGNLVSSWVPALDGAVSKLERGAKVADVGCGLGASTILMAQAFPKSRFFGYDSHPGSIELARKRAAEARVEDRVTFDVAGAIDFPGLLAQRRARLPLYPREIQ